MRSGTVGTVDKPEERSALATLAYKLKDKKFDGKKKAVADAAGSKSPGTFWKQIDENALGTELLIRLAKLADESPSKVLRMGGKEDVADLLEKTYGPSRAERQTLQDLIDELRPLSDDLLAMMLGWFRRLRHEWRLPLAETTKLSAAELREAIDRDHRESVSLQRSGDGRQPKAGRVPGGAGRKARGDQ